MLDRRDGAPLADFLVGLQKEHLSHQITHFQKQEDSVFFMAR